MTEDPKPASYPLKMPDSDVVFEHIYADDAHDEVRVWGGAAVRVGVIERLASGPSAPNLTSPNPSKA